MTLFVCHVFCLTVMQFAHWRVLASIDVPSATFGHWHLVSDPTKFTYGGKRDSLLGSIIILFSPRQATFMNLTSITT